MHDGQGNALLDPGRECSLCPRLLAYRMENRLAEPDWHNAPVPAFGSLDARLLIVGLAPGRAGANRTGRPFTGDYAGDLLYQTLLQKGLASGPYGGHAGDGLMLKDCRITNAVRCVPPENKPTHGEAANCSSFLRHEIAAMPNLKVILSLGQISHAAVLRVLGQKASANPFVHGRIHRLGADLHLADSYHCSRYNTNTRRLTEDMFRSVFDAILRLLRT